MSHELSLSAPSGKPLMIADLGLTRVDDADRFMRAATELRLSGSIPDLLLFLAHPPTVALGLRERKNPKPKDLLVPPERLEREGISLVRSVRGGGITYHWPGQIVCYPVLALEPYERNIPLYMHRLEETAIQTMLAFGLRAVRRRESAAHVGLWHEERKITSMGVRVTRWVTSFGFAINHEGDHGPSEYVRPCGLHGVRLTTMEELLESAPPRPLVMDRVTEEFAEIFHRTPERAPDEIVQSIEALCARGTDLLGTR